MPFLGRFFPDGLPPALEAVAQVFWVLQFALIFHAYKTGRPYYWIFVLFVAPGIGAIAYIGLEILPGIRSPRGLFYALKPRKWKIADLRRDLEECETVKNRLTLAEELFDAGEPEEAHAIAVDCLRGVFKDDPHALADVAWYKVALKRYDEAWEILQRVDTNRDRMLAVRVELMRADCLSGLNRFEEAEQAYERAIDRYIGEAPRVGLALVYEKTNRPDEAAELWRDIRSKFRRASSAWRRTEKSWYKIAKERLAAQKG